MRAYLDIETTNDQRISVIGIYRHDIGTIQLIDGGIHDVAIYEALAGCTVIVTFNGSGFDLPHIKKRMRIDLLIDFAHSDLMYVCRKRGLRGGLKKIETDTGISRGTAGITGIDAPRLWHLYETNHDRNALDMLLRYNQEDVMNLHLLEAHLGIIPAEPVNPTVRRQFD